MSNILTKEVRQRRGEQFLCSLYAVSNANITKEFNIEEIYAKISHSSDRFGKGTEKTQEGQTVQQSIMNDLIYNLTGERLDHNGRIEPYIVLRKNHAEQFVKLTPAGLEYCVEECWLTLADLNIRQPDSTKWKPRPIPSY